MKRICIFAVLVIMLGPLAGCGVEPRTEIIAATVESGSEIGWNEAIGSGVPLSTRIARVQFDIYKCDEVQAVIDADGMQEWLSKYAFCHHNGETLKVSNSIVFEKKKESKHTFFVSFLIDSVATGESFPEDIGNLDFEFTLKGFEASYDGPFEDKTEQEAT